MTVKVDELSARDLVSAALERRPKAVLARACEVAPAMLTRWMSGTSTPDERELETLRRIVSEPIDAPEDADPAQPPADDAVGAKPKAPPASGVDPETGEPAKGKALRCEVNVKGCSVSEKTVALGVEVLRENLDLLAADTSLVNARVAARISVGDDQEELFEGVAPESVEAVADVSKISVGAATIGFRMSFRRGDVDLEAASRYAGKTALLEFKRTGPAGAEGSAEASAGVFDHGEVAAGEAPL